MFLFWFAIVSVVVSAVINLLLGMAVLARNPSNSINKNFFYISISFFIWAICLLLYEFPIILTSLFWIKATYVVVVMLIGYILWFSFIFPFPFTKKELRMGRLGQAIYVLGSMYLLFFTNYWLQDVVWRNNGPHTNLGPGYLLWTLATWAILAWASVNFIRNTKRVTPIQKRQLHYLLAGFILWGIFVNIPDVILPVLYDNTSYFVFSPLSGIFFSAATSYTILKHRFLDIRFVIARVVAYFLLLSTLGLGYSSLIFLIGTQVLPSTVNTDFLVISTMLAMFTALTFQPLKSFYENLTRNFLYHQSYSSDVLLETLGKIIRSNININTLTRKTLRVLKQNLQVNHLAFVLKIDDAISIRSMGYESTPTFSSNEVSNFTAGNNDAIVFYDELNESAQKMLLREHSISAVIPLRVKSTSFGLLLIGPKSTGEIFNQQDIDVIEIFAPQISVAIQNAISYNQVKHFAETLKEEINTATSDLRSANRRLQHLDKLKNEFIFIATHELKNPVTAMRGYLSMFNEGLFGKIPPKMQEPIAQLNASNQQLVELVNDLLQIARTEAKTLTIAPQEVNLCETIDVVVGNVQSLLQQKGLKLTHSCPAPQKCMVHADPMRLKEIINNLVSNAIKYSDQGTITITHQIDKNMIITHVTDQGVGIAKKDQSKIFTRFYRVDEQAARGIPGTGLGLYIIKQIVEKMGGQIWFTSQVGKGSTFSFSLPHQ